MTEQIAIDLNEPMFYWNEVFAPIYAKNNGLDLQTVQQQLSDKFIKLKYGFAHDIPFKGAYFGSQSEDPLAPIIMFHKDWLNDPLKTIHEQSHFLTDPGFEGYFPMSEKDKQLLEKAYNTTDVKSYYSSLGELTEDIPANEYRAINNELRYILADQYLHKREQGYKKPFRRFVNRTSPETLNDFSSYAGYYTESSLKNSKGK